MPVTTLKPHHHIIHASLVCMEMAWATPLVLLLFPGAEMWSALTVFIYLCLGYGLWLLVLERLNHLQLLSPAYEVSVLAAVILSSVLLVIIWPYEVVGQPVGGLGHLFSALLSFEEGLPFELYLIALNFLLWQRAASATTRSMGFFVVSMNFRLGLLFLIIGGGLYTVWYQRSLTTLVWLYFASGLMAISLSRIGDKLTDARSVGKVISRGRLLQLAVIVLTTVGVTALLSIWYTPENIARLFIAASPLFTLLGIVFIWVVSAFAWIIDPLVAWLAPFFAQLFVSIEINTTTGENQGQLGELEGEALIGTLPDWVWLSLRCLVLAIIFAVILGIILLVLNRLRRERERYDLEDAAQEDLSFGGGLLNHGLDRLKNLARLVGQYGLSQNLLAAISVENIYINLCRLGANRNYPRHHSQPPDDYLPSLMKAFAGQEEALRRITVAYMRVHYGEQPVTQAELADLKADYQGVKKAKSIDD